MIQSLTAGVWARVLGVRAGSPNGLLIFGASKFSRELAKVLRGYDFHVILADSNWDSIRLARMDNIPVYYGNPASEHAENYLDLDGIGRVLIISPYRQLNSIVSFHYQDLLGKEKVLGLNNTESASARHQLSEAYLNRLCLFGESVSYGRLATLMSQGAIVKSTHLTESFTLESFRRKYGEDTLPLLYIENGRVHIITASDLESLPIDITLVSLISADVVASQERVSNEGNQGQM